MHGPACGVTPSPRSPRKPSTPRTACPHCGLSKGIFQGFFFVMYDLKFSEGGGPLIGATLSRKSWTKQAQDPALSFFQSTLCFSLHNTLVEQADTSSLILQIWNLRVRFYWLMHSHSRSMTGPGPNTQVSCFVVIELFVQVTSHGTYQSSVHADFVCLHTSL